MKRVLALGAATLASAAIASPALAQESDDGNAGTSSPDRAVTYCRNSTEHPGEGDVVTTDQEAPGGWHECEPGEADGYRKAREQRLQQEADARQAQDKKFQADIDREQAEADKLEEQTRLCRERPSYPTCKPATTSVAKARPAQPRPKPIPYVAAQQEKVSRHGNPAGVGIRPVAEAPDDPGLDRGVDVPDIQQFALEADPAERVGSRNLVWFSVVAMAAIASLGYGLWRVLFIGDV